MSDSSSESDTEPIKDSKLPVPQQDEITKENEIEEDITFEKLVAF